MESLSEDVDSFYDRLEKNERAFKVRSLHEASSKEISNNLESILIEDPLNLPALASTLDSAKHSVYSDLISEDILSRAESELQRGFDSLSSISSLLKVYSEHRTRANEAALNQILGNAMRYRSSEQYLEAREFILMNSVIEEELVSNSNEQHTVDAEDLIDTHSSIVMGFEFIKKSEAGIRWLNGFEAELLAYSIPEGFRTTINSLLLTLKSMKIKHLRDILPVVGRISSSLTCIDDISDNKTVILTLIFLMSAVIAEIVKCSDITEVLNYSLLLNAAYASLGKGLQKVFSSILLNIIHRSDHHSWPNFAKSSIDPARKILVLYGSLVEFSEMESLNARCGWIWLLRACKQLYIFQERSINRSFTEGCISILTFLRHSICTLRRNFGSNFSSLLQRLSSILIKNDLEEAKSLREFVDSFLSKKSIHSKTLLDVPPHVLSAQIFIRYFLSILSRLYSICSSLEEQMNLLTASNLRTVDIQAIGLDGLEGEFNKLGTTKESQLRVVSGIVSMINRAGTNKSLLKYLLSRISQEIVVRSSSQFFSISAGHALPLARLVCELCKIKPDLGHLIRSYFHKKCPLTIPYLCLEISSATERCQILGYESILETDGRQTLESYDKWLARQLKMVVTFFTVAVQVEGSPLGLDDAFTWLLNTTDMIANGKKAAPAFVASLLDCVLRTVSARMFSTYGVRFTSLLDVINEQIVPLLESASPKAKIELKRLEQFLKAATASAGRKFLNL